MIAVHRRNQQYSDKLSALFIGLPRRALATAAATALHRAISETRHDSSRAGANWDLAIGTGSVPTEWNPAEYRQPMTRGGQSSPAIGTRYDAGRHRTMVLEYKAAFYGYQPGPGGLQIPIDGGRLSRLLDVQPASAGFLSRSFSAIKHFISLTPEVRLYNPIYSARWGMYPVSAFAATFAVDGASVVAEVGAYIPTLVHADLTRVLGRGAG